MTGFFNWSTTASSNASVGSINFAEGQAPSTVNDSNRAAMADVAAWCDFISGAKTTVGTDTITLTSGCSITAYTDMMFIAKAGGTNTGAATINIDSLGTKAVEINGSALAAGDITSGKYYQFVYDGTAFQITRLSNTAGDVVGPASATDNSLARFDGTTGKLLKDGAVIGTDVQAYDADTLKADTADVLTAGFAATPVNAGTKSSGTYTPDEAGGNFQYAVNGGAHTLAPPTNNCTLVIQYTNDASAGAITTSGFTIVTGDSLTTTNGDDFFAYITKCNGFSHLHITALQ